MRSHFGHYGSGTERNLMESDIWLAIKVIACGLALVYCGYILGRDKGVKLGASNAIDKLCEGGYLKFTKIRGDIEIHKLDENKG